MHSDLRVYVMNIIINKRAHSLFIVTLIITDLSMCVSVGSNDAFKCMTSLFISKLAYLSSSYLGAFGLRCLSVKNVSRKSRRKYNRTPLAIALSVGSPFLLSTDSMGVRSSASNWPLDAHKHGSEFFA